MKKKINPMKIVNSLSACESFHIQLEITNAAGKITSIPLLQIWRIKNFDCIYYPVHTIERSINFILFAGGKSMLFSFIRSRLFSSARGLLSCDACETF